jgi:hypothetical protein
MSDNGSVQRGEPEAGSGERQATAAISVILFVPSGYEAIRRTMSHLCAQTVAEQIEMVFVTSSHQQLDLEESVLSHFHSWQVVELERNSYVSAGYAAGIRQACAPIVALAEDHAFPDADWAELLIAAHQQTWAAVGPSMRNGNPESLLSWADFYHAYSGWTHPVSSGPIHHLPGHNSSYKRDILLTFGSRLDILMEAESVLHRHLRAQGYRLFLEAGTCTTHLNFTSWSSWFPLRYYIGRQFAAAWAQDWKWPRRLLFTIISPLIPWYRFWRIQRDVCRGQPCRLIIRVSPIVLLGLMIEWLGQILGFAAGPGDSTEKVDKCESRRFK